MAFSGLQIVIDVPIIIVPVDVSAGGKVTQLAFSKNGNIGEPECDHSFRARMRSGGCTVPDHPLHPHRPHRLRQPQPGDLLLDPGRPSRADIEGQHLHEWCPPGRRGNLLRARHEHRRRRLCRHSRTAHELHGQHLRALWQVCCSASRDPSGGGHRHRYELPDRSDVVNLHQCRVSEGLHCCL